MANLQVSGLKSEYRSNLLGTDVIKPRISWQIESHRRGTMQRSYQIQVDGQDCDFDKCLWDTGIVDSEESILVEYSGPELRSRSRYHYRVKVWDNFNRESEWSDTAWWETGLLASDEWKAKWITPDPSEIDPLSESAFLLRKRFELQSDIASARIYTTGVGLYELLLNGERVGDELLSPGWTSYKTRLQYQTYDVTDSLKIGANAIGIMLGDGWYKGTMGFVRNRHNYGDRRAALLQLHVQYNNGTEEIIATDLSWKAAVGPIQFSEIYHGERYDARLEIEGWSHAEINDESWKNVSTLDIPLNHLIAQESNPVRVTETIRPVNSFITPAGDTVIDFGQNMVGRIRLTVVDAPRGTRIVMRHAEVLDKDGNIYFGNLRSAKQTVEYMTKGEGTEQYVPHFTFQGFRYVQVEGYPGQEGSLPLDNFLGEVIHSDMERAGDFECSNSLVNQLQSNILWGQRGNFVDVPTDCPQRDERLGWTGDAQVFIRTALFNYQGGPFFTKWLRDLKAEQLPNGGIPFVIPNVADGHSSAAWGDAAVICPWTVYLIYGDTRLLAEQYESMKAWVEYIRSQGENEYLWNTGFHFGDWLGLDAKEGSYIGATPRDLIATAFYAYSTLLLSKAAAVLGKKEDELKYADLLDRVTKEFNREFVTERGRLAAPTQTSHVLTLMFDLVEGSAKERIASELHQMIIDNEYHLTTGFVGTPYLCFVLSKNGYHQTAVRLLLQESYPGWLYSISKGATTIWEHWDGIKPDGSFWSDDMNSYNHYAYGAIGDWMYRTIAGLDMDETKPAYKRLHIEPQFAGAKMNYARASHQSMYGQIISGWQINGDQIEVELEIPPNTTAYLVLSGATAESLREGNQELPLVEGIHSYSVEKDGVHLSIGSGSYRFVYNNPELTCISFNENTVLKDLLDHKEAREILIKHFPNLDNEQTLHFVKMMTLGKLIESPFAKITGEQINALVEELAWIK
jgi:alpha-L-rhamnosidase